MCDLDRFSQTWPQIVLLFFACTYDQLINYFGSNQRTNFLYYYIKNPRFFSGIRDSYTPEHSCNILVITYIFSFASDLVDNKDIALALGYNLYIYRTRT